MPSLNRPAKRFLKAYEGVLLDARTASGLARSLVQRIAEESGALVHVVTARAKTIESLRGKFRRKAYKRPQFQITDLVGIRVITYYRDQVDDVVSGLQARLQIDSKRSVDKRLALGLRDFGYRSVHLIARLKPNHQLGAGYRFLEQKWFEIQVRSILEHAWSEIEHEIVYKSGIQYPSDTLRRFAALAGTLELLDQEFLSLREERKILINGYLDLYRKGGDERKSFDVARLWAFLEVTRPPSTRRVTLPHIAAGLEASCVEALKSVGLGTPSSLRTFLRRRRFQNNLRSFAALQGISAGDVSHLATVVIAIALKKASVVQYHFPEIIYDPAIATLLAGNGVTRQNAS